MLTRVLGAIGLALLVVGVVLAAAMAVNAAQVAGLDKFNVQQGMVLGEPPCAWQADVSDRVMSENETRVVQVLMRTAMPETCRSEVRLSAPGFVHAPRNETQVLAVPAGRTGSIAWALTPNKTGNFDILLADDLTTQTIGLRVTDVLGLSAGQAKVLSTIGSILGPMCTAPWWIDKWLQRRNKRNEKAARDDADPKRNGPAPEQKPESAKASPPA
jgi:hypothetical protein